MSPDTARSATSTTPARSPQSSEHALILGEDGWLVPAAGILFRPSPNHDPRPGNENPTLLVLHNISLPPGVFSGSAVIDFFCNTLDFDQHPWYENIRGVRVSAHFFIRRDGTIVQFVATTERAWHAGASSFRGRARCNDFSVGIELEGTDTLPCTAIQYTQAAALTRALRTRHALTDVCGHEHIAPGRKTDPGPAFDWLRYGRAAGWADEVLPRLAQ
ncbi:1,6-anhydro-N-acetylmuramyl-L-alanine amidase AmpD [Castellaniella sp.]|uniref:1,6-anhydro-N-acetylmuramyl-L-alanine amidase AmpD n=1 Tax=Castellaniella sp. TaxID=1955812 RepID=UPI00355E0389